MLQKYFLYLSLFLIFIFRCNYVSAEERCIEGTLLKGQNQHIYCLSNIGLNWWSAFTWCEMQGRALVSLRTACDISKDRPYTKQYCYNLRNAEGPGSGESYWTANSKAGSTHAVGIYNEGGKKMTLDTKKTATFRALCY